MRIMASSTNNNTFSSNLGVILAAVGSAVGLGNVWRFPYICGKYGGGAFLLVYLVFVFLLGGTMMISEFVIGRHTRQNPSKALPTLVPSKPGWRFAGHFGVLANFVTLALYWVIAGWTTFYFIDSCTGTISSLGVEATAVTTFFNSFVSNPWLPIASLVGFGIVSMAVIMGGVRKGIEAVSKLLMPILALLLVGLCIFSLTLDGAGAGLSYMFQFDFSKLTSEAILAALGQALFSLSVGIGMMIVYGGYIPKEDNLVKTTLWITLADTLIAVMAGVAIFPAVFSCGMEPTEGAGLVFKVLPVVFNSMGGAGQFVAIAFFLLLVVAALTSAISMLEVLSVWFTENTRLQRRGAALVSTVATLGVAVVLSLSNGVLGDAKVFGRTFFDIFDLLSGTYLFPLSALALSIFAGWVMPVDVIRDEMSTDGTQQPALISIFRFLLRYIVPLALIVVLVASI